MDIKTYAEMYLQVHNKSIRETFEGLETIFFREMLGELHGHIEVTDRGYAYVEVSHRDTDSGVTETFEFPVEFLGVRTNGQG